MLRNQNTNILLLEAKDVIKDNGYTTTPYTKYKGTFDYSLEAIKIDELDEDAFVMNNGKQYSNAVVNVKFKYNLKDESGKVIMKTDKLRAKLYEEGFDVDGMHYVRFKRGAGSARQGKCLFVREDLYEDLMEWSYMGIDYTEGVEMDLAKIETYMSLTTSSIIGTLNIKPENILLIEDRDSLFKEKVMATELDSNNRLTTAPKVADIKNNIWDGQSLLDSSVFDDNGYSDKGFLLLRNRFFKSACFNTNIQQYFIDKEITSVLQLNGQTAAKDIKDIKLITTISSIKYLGLFEDKFALYLSKLDEIFGIVKYDKGSHHINGMVSTHYQLINTLQLTKDEVKSFLKETVDYMYLLKTSLPAFREHIKLTKVDAEAREFDAYNSGRMMYNLLAINDDFAKTKLFKDYRSETISAYKENAKKGHILVKGNYSTLCGNAPEMLKFSINKFDIDNTPSELQGKEIHSKAFDYDKDILACRSPHVTMGNILMAVNKDNRFINTYFHKSEYIVHINAIRVNTLETLSGADYDSDTALLTDNELLVSKGKLNDGKFLVPNDFIGKSTIKRHNTTADKTDLDIKTSKSQSAIGKIVNLSQLLNSEYWDRVSKGEDVTGLYELICSLDVMSCIAIDSAKKESPVQMNKELELIKSSKWITKGVKPFFFQYTRKKYYTRDDDGNKKESEDKTTYVYKETPMDYLEEVLNKKTRVVSGIKQVPLADLLNKNIDRTKANKKQILSILSRVQNDNDALKTIWNGLDKENKESMKDGYFARSIIKENLIKYIKSLKMNKETMATLIYRLHKDYSHGLKGNSLTEYGRLLLTALFEGNNTIFLQALNLNKQNISVLEADEAGNINIYGKRYREIAA